MIHYWKKKQLIELKMANTTYWIGLAFPAPICLYWGAHIDARDVWAFNERDERSSFDSELWRERAEYPVWDGRTFGETALRADKPIFLTIKNVDCNGDVLSITLYDEQSHHQVRLCYVVDAMHDVIVKTAKITAGEEGLTLYRAASGACCPLTSDKPLWLHYTAGTWAGEFQRRETVLSEGTMKLGSSRGMSGPHLNPALMVTSAVNDAAGMAYAVLLGWSGCWQMTASQSVFRHARVIAGYGGDDFKAVLEAGESLETPPMYLACSGNGITGASQILHNYERDVLAPQGRRCRVLYNSWEATNFDVNVKTQMSLACRAAQMGIELFVVDDGWFGARDNDQAGLGDWTVNPRKFPNGLEELITHVEKLGMDFGLWVEPESVNPDSDLFRAHPNWIHRLQNHEPMMLRGQYLLDFSKPEVEAFALQMLRNLLTKYSISYLKWDMNRPFTDIDEQFNPMSREKHVWALYRILEILKQEYPTVSIETCSGGGARVDLGMIRRTDQFWPSDNTDPFERLLIQEGCSLFYSPALTSCWVTDTPKSAHRAGRNNLLYKFHVAMCGELGVGADISKLTEDEIAVCAEQIAAYKRVRSLILEGDQYRLCVPSRDEQSSVEYVAKDGSECVLFAFLHSQCYGQMTPRVCLRGLKTTARYRCIETNELVGGATLMNFGVQLPLQGDFDSVMRHYKIE